MIAALARAGGVFAEQSYVEAAERAAGFILTRLRTDRGSLLHRYRAGEAAMLGYATDYAYLIWGLIELYEATFDSSYLQLAIELMATFIDKFWDEDEGGFFLTADEAESLFARPRNDTDGAMPSAGSVALLDLLKIGRMTQNTDYEDRAVSLVRTLSPSVESNPLAFTFLLCALDFQLGPSIEVVIAGERSASDTHTLVRAVRGEFVPNKVVLFRAVEEHQPEIVDLAPFIDSHVPIDGKAAAYVCRDYACHLPVTDSERLLRLLRDG